MTTHLTATGEVENTKRHRFYLDDERYYLVMDRKFCMVKVPYENRLENLDKRRALESMAEAVTAVLQMWAYEDWKTEDSQTEEA